jgi:hypothetical protein
MRPRVKTHQRRLTAAICQEQVEQGTKFGQFVKLQRTYSALFHRHHERNRRCVHLFLHPDFLRDAIVLQNEISCPKAINNFAVALFNQRRNQNFIGGYSDSRGLLLRAR